MLHFLQVSKGIKNLEKLKILDISHCTCITDEGLKSICQLRNLTSLNVNMCTQVCFLCLHILGLLELQVPRFFYTH